LKLTNTSEKLIVVTSLIVVKMLEKINWQIAPIDYGEFGGKRAMDVES
jgi:N-acyl-L-homoserine lactone synthetase